MRPGPAPAELVARGRQVTELGFDLARRLPPEGNLVASPLSVWLCLMTLVPGARGATLRGLGRVLGAGDGDAGGLPAAAGRLARSLATREAEAWEEDPQTGEFRPRPKEIFTLAIANGLWAAEGHPLREDFVKVLVEELDAHAASVDYGEPQAAADRINGWVSRNTGGRIGDLVRAAAISPLTRLVLTNATYFKAAWREPFLENRTAPETFHTPTGRVEVPMMRGEGLRRHVTDRKLGLQAALLPYDAMHAVVILPDEGAWSRVVEAVSADLVDRLVARMAEKSVDLHLPRFGVQAALELSDALSALGLGDLFGAEADLAGISPHPESLYVSNVVHSANVTVDEAGTEAAAATALDVLGEALLESEPEKITMRVDRPFLFLVRDPDTGTVLFLARVMDPTA